MKDDHCYGCKQPFRSNEIRVSGNSHDMLRWMVGWHRHCLDDAEAKHREILAERRTH